MTRLFVDLPLEPDTEVDLPDAAAHHARTVLRLRREDRVNLFNGDGRELAATLTRVSRERVSVRIAGLVPGNTESPLVVELVQAISRGERMDYTLQKAVELGVSSIVPVISERTVVRLDRGKAEKRLAHWRGVIQHAAEQSGRRVLPGLAPVSRFDQWLASRDPARPACVLHPNAATPLSRLPRSDALVLVAGPEGGFSSAEIDAMTGAGVVAASLGPRILRTETAAVTALAVMQALWGDLA